MTNYEWLNIFKKNINIYLCQAELLKKLKLFHSNKQTRLFFGALMYVPKNILVGLLLVAECLYVSMAVPAYPERVPQPCLHALDAKYHISGFQSQL